MRWYGLDPELDTWVDNILLMGAGSFLRYVHCAAVNADPENYALMRPLLLQLKAKYPEYAEEPHGSRR